MTRKWDPVLEQYRDSGRFAGNDGATASGGMNALAGQHQDIFKAKHIQHADGRSTMHTPSGDVLHYDKDMRLHNLNGPAVQSMNGQEYYLYGAELSKQDFDDLQSKLAPHQSSGIELTGYVGEDGATVYQLDTNGDGDHIRINVNDSTAWDGVVGERPNSHWICWDHDSVTVELTFEQVRVEGTPVCEYCGDDMVKKGDDVAL